MSVTESTDHPTKETGEMEGSMSDSADFMKLYEESLKSFQEGKVVKGTIVQVDDEYVLVDIGYKSEGRISVAEFADLEGHFANKVGDLVDVLLVRKEDKNGNIILSRTKAAISKIWQDVKEIYESGGTIQGRITSPVKGGFSVDIGIQAFLPGSQADLRPVRDANRLVGSEHDFKILKYDERQRNIVLSRRAILEGERMALREETLQHLEEDAVIEGIVKNITPYGMFIDLGGIDGLVHITDMSWGRVGHPSEMHKVGDLVQVKVLSFDQEKERVSLGIKQLTPDPWSQAVQKYSAGTRLQGSVISLKDYGAFVEIEKGMEGLVHISEMSWTQKIRHPSQLLNVGDLVDALVLDLDVDKKRISLSIKQVEPNPWDTVAEKFPVGTIIEGKIKNIEDFGIFIPIDEGIDGLVHISDISWTKKIRHPSEHYKKGQEVRAVVLNIEKQNERFALGIKQLTTDPWDEIPYKYKRGTLVTGTVTSITDFGLFVELEEGIEGLVHISELPGGKDESPLAGYNVGDVIQARVVHVSRKDEKIGLSVKKIEEAPEKTNYRDYVNNPREATSNLGELLIKQMKNLEDDGPGEGQESTEPRSSDPDDPSE